MSNTVQMPALGESVTEGTVTRWLKEVGEEVAVDEPLLEVSTDKVDTEIPSPYAGVLEKKLAEEDDEVEVGGDLAVIGDGSGSDDADDDSDDDSAEEESEAPAEDDADESADESADEGADEEPEAEEKPKKKKSSGSGDSTEVTMPALGESVTEGTVTRWLKEVGDEVEVDEPLLEVSTDKVDTEVPSPVAGIVEKLLVDEDEDVEVGAPLAVIGSGEGTSDDSDDDDSADDEAEADEAAAEEAPAEDAEDESAEESDDAADEAADEESEEKAEEEVEEPKKSEEKAEKTAEAPAAEAQSAAAEQASGEKSISSAVGRGDSAAYVTPLVRKLAKKEGVDLSTVTGTGVGGRIRKQDVLEAAKQKAAAAPADAPAAAAAPKAEPYRFEISEEAQKLRGTTQKASRIRQTIAKRMRESLQQTSQLTQVIEVDVTNIAKLRRAKKDAFQQKHGVKLTYLPFFSKAVVEALQMHPVVNAQLDLEAKEIEYFEHVNLGMAVDTPRGLLVPVIKNAEELSLAGLAKATDDLAARTRDSKIGPDELSGGTFSITNIGSFGAFTDTPIINYPQAGILGTGAIVRRPVVRTTADGDEAIVIRDIVMLPLTYNHELVDGADAGRFLSTLKKRLEEGDFEADLEL